MLALTDDYDTGGGGGKHAPRFTIDGSDEDDDGGGGDEAKAVPVVAGDAVDDIELVETTAKLD